MEVSVPSPDAHWTLEFRDIAKPFPQEKVANATFKVIRFLYPPFALGMVDVIPVVNDPQPDCANIFLVLGIAFVLGLLLVYVTYTCKFPVKPSPSIENRTMERRGFWDRIPSRRSGGTTGAEYLRILDMYSRQAAERDNEDRVHRNVSEEGQPGASHIRSQNVGLSANHSRIRSSGPSAGPSSGPSASHSRSPSAGPSAGPSGNYQKTIPCQFHKTENKTEIDLTDLIEQIDETVQER
ncbi:uncharacterized protein LOC117580232 [Drosophila guanche]|uniref:Uncharacterized protein n=1 Tax=Drosophila guanche TaxID=7266 RepID=A0A3B0J4B5_DROGU|nr:uncharacterized protein LOC117580232 [Drosophila guanche]SPP76347.1 Hypothetical predicted protein [Drosophila guanche]